MDEENRQQPIEGSAPPAAAPVPELGSGEFSLPTVDEILAEQRQEQQEEQPDGAVTVWVEEEEEPHKGLHTFLRVVRNLLLILLETVLLIAGGLYCVMFVLCKGPSPTARGLFVRSVRETSAIGFLANWYLTDEEIAALYEVPDVEVLKETDPSLITIPAPTPAPDPGTEPVGPQPDAWGLVDEDEDGIIVERIRGEGYQGYMMVVLDPSRVTFACVPESFERRGYTVEAMVKRFGAVAGTNAGGFYDVGGHGNGSVPDGMTVVNGRIYYQNLGVGDGFMGFDADHILHVGKFTADDVRERGITDGVSFGPILVANGEPQHPERLYSGLNPRTGIGQRSDGAVLMLVIEGRQTTSLGATMADMVDIFLSYGAVNAANLDGGSSSMMWFNDGYLNASGSVVGIRPVPTAVLVMPAQEGGVTDGGT